MSISLSKAIFELPSRTVKFESELIDCSTSTVKLAPYSPSRPGKTSLSPLVSNRIPDDLGMSADAVQKLISYVFKNDDKRESIT